MPDETQQKFGDKVHVSMRSFGYGTGQWVVRTIETIDDEPRTAIVLEDDEFRDMIAKGQWCLDEVDGKHKQRIKDWDVDLCHRFLDAVMRNDGVVIFLGRGQRLRDPVPAFYSIVNIDDLPMRESKMEAYISKHRKGNES